MFKSEPAIYFRETSLEKIKLLFNLSRDVRQHCVFIFSFFSFLFIISFNKSGSHISANGSAHPSRALSYAFKFATNFRSSKGCSPALALGKQQPSVHIPSLIRGCVRKHAQLTKVHRVRASRVDAGLRIGVKVRPHALTQVRKRKHDVTRLPRY